MKMNKKGFTIVELVIVIAVVAILAAVLIPTFSSLVKKANESADIQAVREMNVFLSTAKVTDGVDSILDVYEVFDESGFKVENYHPLYEGRTFYYSAEYNQILYVDDATGKVVFPEQYKDQTQGTQNWMSLSMTIGYTEADKPADYAFASNAMTATISNAKQYAYVIDKYNESSASSLNLTVDGTLDLSGASIAIAETKGEVVISGTNNAVIKNIVSNKFYSTSTNNTSQIMANYYSGAIAANTNHKVTIKNVTFENLNVKSPDAGAVALLCGQLSTGGSLELENVTIKNSTVVGGRSVAALVGATAGGSGTTAVTVKGNLTLDNVNVYTTQGRSSLLVNTNSEVAMSIAADATITLNNSACKYYEDAKLQQVKTTEATYNNVTVSHKIVDAAGNNAADFNVYFLKTIGGEEYSMYAHKENALVLQYVSSNTRVAYTTVEELMAKYQR